MELDLGKKGYIRKMKTVVIPSEYVDKNDDLFITLVTAEDKNGNKFVICKTKDAKNLIIPREDLLENYYKALDGRKIETPENDVHRDEELDVFNSFQEAVAKEAGVITLEESQ